MDTIKITKPPFFFSFTFLVAWPGRRAHLIRPTPRSSIRTSPACTDSQTEMWSPHDGVWPNTFHRGPQGDFLLRYHFSSRPHAGPHTAGNRQPAPLEKEGPESLYCSPNTPESTVLPIFSGPEKMGMGIWGTFGVKGEMQAPGQQGTPVVRVSMGVCTGMDEDHPSVSRLTSD